MAFQRLSMPWLSFLISENKLAPESEVEELLKQEEVEKAVNLERSNRTRRLELFDKLVQSGWNSKCFVPVLTFGNVPAEASCAAVRRTIEEGIPTTQLMARNRLEPFYLLAKRLNFAAATKFFELSQVLERSRSGYPGQAGLSNASGRLGKVLLRLEKKKGIKLASGTNRSSKYSQPLVETSSKALGPWLKTCEAWCKERSSWEFNASTWEFSQIQALARDVSEPGFESSEEEESEQQFSNTNHTDHSDSPGPETPRKRVRRQTPEQSVTPSTAPNTPTRTQSSPSKFKRASDYIPLKSGLRTYVAKKEEDGTLCYVLEEEGDGGATLALTPDLLSTLTSKRYAMRKAMGEVRRKEKGKAAGTEDSPKV